MFTSGRLDAFVGVWIKVVMDKDIRGRPCEREDSVVVGTTEFLHENTV
jgi:hypothetical protein